MLLFRTKLGVFLTFMVVLGFMTNGLAQKKSPPFDVKNLRINWGLKENKFQNKRQYLSSFTFTNQGKTVFPSKGWTIYFNYIRDIEPASVSGGVKIEPVNGDIFRIVPTADFRELKQNQSVSIDFVSSELFVNVSDAPFGFYIVWDNAPESGYSITNYISEAPKEDKIGYLSAADIFKKNSKITDIPQKKLTKVFPTPEFYQEGEGELTLDESTRIVADGFFQKEASYLADELSVIFGKKPSVVNTGTDGKSIIFRKNESAPEAYQLSVKPSGIEISASTPSGAFYAIQSLKSLIPSNAWAGIQQNIKVPVAEVKDAPRFGFRSIMLDVGRNFQKPVEIKKVLDLMALYKLNVLHIHLIEDEGWRLEIPSLPELTEIGSQRGHTLDSKKFLPASFGAGPVPGATSASGYYTRAEFIDLLKYANDRHIQIIPEVESPGHARASIKAMDVRYERFLAQGNKEEAEKYLLRDINDKSEYRTAQLWTDNIICVGLPSTYRFAEKVVDEIVEMYKEAKAPLTTIHFGGDEVPAGVWEKSPVCQDLIKNTPSLKNTDDLWYYYFGKINDILKKKGLFLSGWEEIAMRKTSINGNKTLIPNPVLANENFQVNVWNNMIGWGAEDLPYRLANAGYKVVLSCVSNMYFDLAYQRTYEEPGYYWGGFVDIDKPFYFIPYDYFKNSKEDRRGNPIEQSYFIGKDRLTDYGKSNIVGVQGLLWSESVKTPERLEYMLLPKMFGLAERAWAKDPAWAIEKDEAKSAELYTQAWSEFVNVVGKRELPRLDNYGGGFQYRIPTPGVILENGKAIANIQLPGLTIRYTTDGSEPGLQSKVYTEPVADKGKLKFKVFNTKGRASRTVEVTN